MQILFTIIHVLALILGYSVMLLALIYLIGTIYQLDRVMRFRNVWASTLADVWTILICGYIYAHKSKEELEMQLDQVDTLIKRINKYPPIPRAIRRYVLKVLNRRRVKLDLPEFKIKQLKVNKKNE